MDVISTGAYPSADIIYAIAAASIRAGINVDAEMNILGDVEAESLLEGFYGIQQLLSAFQAICRFDSQLLTDIQDFAHPANIIEKDTAVANIMQGHNANHFGVVEVLAIRADRKLILPVQAMSHDIARNLAGNLRKRQFSVCGRLHISSLLSSLVVEHRARVELANNSFADCRPTDGRPMHVVPRTGIEPVRSFQPGFLRPLRLPIPPPRHEDVPNVQIGTWHIESHSFVWTLPVSELDGSASVYSTSAAKHPASAAN